MGSAQSTTQPQTQQKSWWASLTGQTTQAPAAPAPAQQPVVQSAQPGVGGSRKNKKSTKKMSGGKNKTSSKRSKK